MIRVGIPRALLYYQYFPLWQAYLQALGAEVVVSSPTSKQEVARGSANLVAETCLPVKVFCGHVYSLIDQCDYLFIPSIRSVGPGEFNCSKFLGLPDMMRAALPQAPPLLDADIDVGGGKRDLYQAIYRLSRPLTWNPLRVKQAVNQGFKAHHRYQQEMIDEELTPPQALARREGQASPPPETSPLKATLAVIGHPYLVYDEYINHRLLTKLNRMGVRVLTSEMVPEAEQRATIARLEGNAYWTYEGEVVGAAGYYLERGVDGVIGVAAFGCGPDSLMMDTVKRLCRQRGKPFLCLTLDEHSAEAGLLTRLEAFVDMMVRKKRCE